MVISIDGLGISGVDLAGSPVGPSVSLRRETAEWNSACTKAS
jgi:hypothetical protein